MKLQGAMFLGVAVFFAVADVIYWYLPVWSDGKAGQQDPTGAVALLIAILFALLVGYYLTYTHRRVPAEELYEDDKDAEVADGAGEIGFYSPHSWWPLALAGSCAIAFLGIPIGWWLFLIGAMFGILSVIGWVFEYYRGEFRH